MQQICKCLSFVYKYDYILKLKYLVVWDPSVPPLFKRGAGTPEFSPQIFYLDPSRLPWQPGGRETVAKKSLSIVILTIGTRKAPNCGGYFKRTNPIRRFCTFWPMKREGFFSNICPSLTVYILLFLTAHTAGVIHLFCCVPLLGI